MKRFYTEYPMRNLPKMGFLDLSALLLGLESREMEDLIFFLLIQEGSLPLGSRGMKNPGWRLF